jgi:V/A-type H+/Na+-transporting ATPase subunit I
MIVPMYKYAFLVYYAGYPDFLEDLRKLGVVHIDKKVTEPNAEMQDLMRQITEIKQSIKKLDWFKVAKDQQVSNFTDGQAVFSRVKEIEKEQEYIQHHRAKLDKEVSQLEPWENFNWSNLARLEPAGLQFRFFTCPSKKFDTQWSVDHYISIINEARGLNYFVKIDRQDADLTDFLELPGVEQVFLPQSSLDDVQAELKEVQEKSKNLHDELEQIAGNGKELLENYYNGIRDNWEAQNALLQTSNEVEGKVRVMQGFVPETRKKELDDYLEKKRILHIVSPPDQEVKSPILLKNNKFTRLYEVIAKLYDLPNHTELDLVPFFAPFYMVFFGFCMGDAGYGLLMVIGGGIAKKYIPKMKEILSLAQWLGLSTIIFGCLTGTFFGIPLIDADIPFLQNVQKYMLDTNKLFNLALILGAIQILFGMFVRVFNIGKSQGFRYSFSTIGWLILLIGSGVLFGLKSAAVVTKPTAGIIQNIILLIAVILIFLLNHPKRNVLINIGAGLWDAYGMASGIFGDLLSYIRLFALSISGGILGFVFNQLATSLRPDNIILGPLVMIIILVLGHTINIFMCALGAFVHPMRLTFVEFYKNAGFAGGGKAYTPFEQHVSKV